ncbi:MAG: reverse transcriptase-like protein [Patescibacteria group bacterium]
MVHLKIVTDAACRTLKPGFKGKAVGVAQFYDVEWALIQSEEFILGEMVAYAAEAETVLLALDVASGLTRGSIEIWTDSEALVRHMNGDYRLRSKLSRQYFDKIKIREARFEEVKYYHQDRSTPRGKIAHTAAASAYSKVHA